METQKVFRKVRNQLCVETEKYTGGRGSWQLKILAQPTKTYRDEECRLVFDYIATKLKEILTVVKHRDTCWGDRYQMNENVEECITHILNVAKVRTFTSISIGYHGPHIYFRWDSDIGPSNLLPANDLANSCDTSKFRALVESSNRPIPFSSDRLEVVDGKLCSFTNESKGRALDFATGHYKDTTDGDFLVLGQPVITYDDAECKQVFDYILSKLERCLKVLPLRDALYQAIHWNYNHLMNDDIDKCIDYITKIVGSREAAFKYEGGRIYFNVDHFNKT